MIHRRKLLGRAHKFVAALLTCALLGACGKPQPIEILAAVAAPMPAGTWAPVFVIALENHDAEQIYGNRADAPYINDTLLPNYAHALAFTNLLPDVPSEPHYVLMEAGTNSFADTVFRGDGDPTATNSTASTEHLVAQIRSAGGGRDWMAYQEGLGTGSGTCPVHSAGFYAPKHNPFVFFQDIAGNPPNPNQPYCAAHHRSLEALEADLAAERVAAYNFISPDQCHDMHGAAGCTDKNPIRAGDNWLRMRLPAVLDYVNRHGGVIFLVWDEGRNTHQVPFLALGPNVKKGYASPGTVDHASLLRTIEELLRLPALQAVAGHGDLNDLFLPGTLH